MNSSESPPSPESRTQLIIVRGSEEEEGSSRPETTPSSEASPAVTYRVLGAEDSVLGGSGGQFYVIGEGGGRVGKSGNPLRDDRRRATHNEVERRRRDMINTWIMKLARLIPNLANTSGKSNTSKGGILAKACEYLQSIKSQMNKVEEIKKVNEGLLRENERLNLALSNFKKENAALKKQVESLGVTPETVKFEL